MTTLPAMLGMVTAILQSHPLCEQAAIAETREFSQDQFFFKVRAKFPRPILTTIMMIKEMFSHRR